MDTGNVGESPTVDEHESDFDFENCYYVAGTYDTRKDTIQMKLGVE